MLLLLLAASSQASESITIEGENMYWIEREVSKGEVIDIRLKLQEAAFAVVVSDSKFYLDIGTNCRNKNYAFTCDYWGNAKQNGLYGLCQKTLGDQQNFIFTAAEQGRIRLITGSAYSNCNAKVSVVSARVVSSFSLPSGAVVPQSHCLFSGDLKKQLSLKTEGQLDTEVTVEARYLNSTVQSWTAGQSIKPAVASDFVRVISSQATSAELKEPTVSSQGSSNFDFGDHRFGEYHGSKLQCSDTYFATAWTTGGETVEILDGKHVEEPDPEPETVSSEDETDVESSVSETDETVPHVSETDDDEDLIDASSSHVTGNDDPKGDGPNVGAIVGGSVGGLGCVSCVMVFVFVCWNRKQDSEKQSVSHSVDDEVPETQQEGSEDIPGF